MAKTFGVIIPFLLSAGVIDLIGSIVSKRDEAIVQSRFSITELRKGNPVLIYKHKDRKGIITREFYTMISFDEWKKIQDSICDAFDENLIGEIQRGGKNNNNGNRVILHTTKGRIPNDRGSIYDEI